MIALGAQAGNDMQLLNPLSATSSFEVQVKMVVLIRVQSAVFDASVY